MDQSDKEDKELSNSAQRILAIIIAVFEAVAYVFSGMYGDLETLGVFRALLIVI